MKQKMDIEEYLEIRYSNSKDKEMDNYVPISIMENDLLMIQALKEKIESSYADQEIKDISAYIEPGSVRIKFRILQQIKVEFLDEPLLRKEFLEKRAIRKHIKSFKRLEKIYSPKKKYQENISNGKYQIFEDEELLWEGEKFIYDAFQKVPSKKRITSINESNSSLTDIKYKSEKIIFNNKEIEDSKEVYHRDEKEIKEMYLSLSEEVLQDEYHIDYDGTEENDIILELGYNKDYIEIIILDEEDNKWKVKQNIAKFGYFSDRKIQIIENVRKPYIQFRGRASFDRSKKSGKPKLQIEEIVNIVYNKELTENSQSVNSLDYFENVED